MSLLENRSVYLPAMSRARREELAADPRAVVVLPVGATEQHGPHLPLATDSLIGLFLLEAVMHTAPEFPLGVSQALLVSKSSEHLDFPGTLSVDGATLADLVVAQLQQLRDWGFRRVAILNSHGGNRPVLVPLVRTRQLEGDRDLYLLRDMPEIPELPEREQRYGIHAGEYESSLLLARVPELCRMEAADTVWMDEGLKDSGLRPEDAPAVFAWTMKDLSASGTLGDATRATAEKGERWIRQAAEHVLRQLRELSA